MTIVRVDGMDLKNTYPDGSVEIVHYPHENPDGTQAILAAQLRPGDVVKCRIGRKLLEEHLEAVKDPANAYSHLNSPDFTVLEIKHAVL